MTYAEIAAAVASLSLLAPLAALYALWLFYLAVMNLKRAKDAGTIGRLALWLGYPILFLGLVLDLIVNVMLSLLFLDLPQEMTVTARLKRYVQTQPERWRGIAAQWFATHLLDTFDPSGKHV